MPKPLSKICLIMPSLRVGGMERVMSQLANLFSREKLFEEIHLVLFVKTNKEFQLDACIKVHEPSFNYQNYNRLHFTLKTLVFLRERIKSIQPHTILSFGDRYNAFVILSALGLGLKIFVSNRMNPYLSNGRFLDIMNKVFYPFADGVIAQTTLARNVFYRKGLNKNIVSIGNPIRFVNPSKKEKTRPEKIILNVGRFTAEKQQEQLVKYFIKINDPEWRLILLGEGTRRKLVEEYICKHANGYDIEILDNADDLDEIYSHAEIFAFTSVSEGFPNVLGEALSTPLACISYDCIAGPSDLIKDGVNGYLIKIFDHNDYISKLTKLMKDRSLRDKFKTEAKKRIQPYRLEIIGQKYYDFITA